MTRPRRKHGIDRIEYDMNRRLYRVDNPASSTDTHAALGRRFGVDAATIRAARAYVTWRHMK